MATSARLTLDATTPQSAGGTDTGPSGGVVVLFPQASGTILFGASDMTTSTGARKTVAAGDVFTLDVPSGDAVYLLCASSTLAVDVLRIG
jgi:hypothetical protein